jgi:hypothetical protein
VVSVAELLELCGAFTDFIAMFVIIFVIFFSWNADDLEFVVLRVHLCFDVRPPTERVNSA